MDISPSQVDTPHMFEYIPFNSPRSRRDSPGLGIPRSGRSLPQAVKIRRRGAQPGNSNAFRYGLYSAQTPHTHAIPLIPRPEQKDPFALLNDLEGRMRSSGRQELRAYRVQLAHMAVVSNAMQSFKEILSQARAAALIVGKMQRINHTLSDLEGRRTFFSSLVRDLPALLRWEFSEMGIPVPPVFVPHKLVNVHANLSWEAPAITAVQWEFLQGIMVAQRADMDYFRKYRRRKPLPCDRFLLEGVLWKLANGLRWRDLAGKYPVRRCQELYGALVRSGRMQTVYNRLWGHLDVNGDSTLADLVARGCFVVSGNRVLLAPSEQLT
jgi:hypothetical protein